MKTLTYREKQKKERPLGRFFFKSQTTILVTVRLWLEGAINADAKITGLLIGKFR
jgi:hypothetical protein